MTASPSTGEPTPAPRALRPEPLPRPFLLRAGGMWTRLAVACGALAALLAITYGTGLPRLPLCGLKLTVGYPCPGCGMTRAVVAVPRGDVLASLAYHPLGIAVVGGLLAAIWGAARGLVTGRDPVWEAFERRGSLIAGAFLGALLLVWVVRVFLVPGWHPDPVGTGGLLGSL